LALILAHKEIIMVQSITMTEGQVSGPAPKARRAVRIHVTGGMVLEGNMVVPQTRAVSEVLNDKQPFLEFESANGQKLHVSKAMILTLQMLDLPKTPKTAH